MSSLRLPAPLRLPAALLLSVSLLTACGGAGAPMPVTQVPAPAPHSVSGSVTFPAITSQSLRSYRADWSLPHVAGKVLITGGLQALSVTPALRNVPAGMTEQAYADTLTRAGYTVQPDYLYSPLNVSSDPGVPDNAGIGSRHLHQDYLTRTNTLAAWAALLAEGHQPVSAIVADLDTGVTLTHSEFAGRLLPGYDTCSGLSSAQQCVGEDSDPSETTDPEAGHGSATMGLIGALSNNAAGIAGMSWSGQTLLPIKVFGDDGEVDTATSVSVARHRRGRLEGRAGD